MRKLFNISGKQKNPSTCSYITTKLPGILWAVGEHEFPQWSLLVSVVSWIMKPFPGKPRDCPGSSSRNWGIDSPPLPPPPTLLPSFHIVIIGKLKGQWNKLLWKIPLCPERIRMRDKYIKIWDSTQFIFINHNHRFFKSSKARSQTVRHRTCNLGTIKRTFSSTLPCRVTRENEGWTCLLPRKKYLPEILAFGQIFQELYF